MSAPRPPRQISAVRRTVAALALCAGVTAGVGLGVGALALPASGGVTAPSGPSGAVQTWG